MYDNVKYIIDKKENRQYIGDKRFKPSPKNFHNIVYNKNFFCFTLDVSEEFEWRQSERYNRL